MRIRSGLGHLWTSMRLALIPVVHAEQPWIDGEFTVGERLKIAVTAGEYDGFSNEVKSIVLITTQAVIGSTMSGAFIHSMNHFVDFMKTNQPQHYDSHWDAKDALRKALERGGILGALEWGKRTFCVALAFALLWNFIPVIRNKIDWHEHVVAGGVAGTVAGVVYSDPKPLGLKEIKKSVFGAHRRRFILKSSALGLLGGVLLAVLCAVRTSRSHTDARNWAQYRQRKNLHFADADDD